MTKEQMDSLKYFSPKWDKVLKNKKVVKNTDYNLMLLFDKVREIAGVPVSLHCLYQDGGHTSNSQHYLGRAGDFHFVTKKGFLEQTKMMLRILKQIGIKEKVGLGVYPCWNNKGFHLDNRGYKARWSRINNVYKSFEDGFDYIFENNL